MPTMETARPESATPQGPNCQTGRTATNAAGREQPEVQLRAGIEMIVQAFEQKTRETQAELSHWKQVASQQRQQIVTFESEMGQLTAQLDDKDRTINLLNQEKKALITSKSALIDKYNVLRKNAVQLDTFRKQLASMLELNPAAVIPEHDTSFVDATGGAAADLYNNAASAIINPAGDDLFNADSFQVSKNHNQPTAAPLPATRSTKQTDLTTMGAAMDAALNDALETLTLTPFVSADADLFPKLETATGPSKSPARKQPGRQTSSASSDSIVLNRSRNSATADKSMEAPALYKQIRDVLSPTQFDQFASTIAGFNAGTVSAEQTIQKLTQLIPSEHLVGQMRRLVHRALAESPPVSSNARTAAR